MNRFMKSQIDGALLSLRTLKQSIEFSAMQDDGQISREERSEIKKIRKAINRFEKDMAKIR